jgi:hypothetical protein
MSMEMRQIFLFPLYIEALHIKMRIIFDPQGIILFPIRSLTPQQAKVFALAAGFKHTKKGVPNN